ncbi:uncharacterized protein J4E88_004569 [Alternaria novae-zelandiae]|uniref:uncharacterized protein n=1 Tax=Alternaria novae-zelandiae TaxID=430562 RepID=UPI0020C54727|nr:uncharacterized protein J4E88_004569 [Alternaria novae-zelandiae]KAI4683393.1 hypothetical protein J4E88_004569 [Alternaria novae-zelandiae]
MELPVASDATMLAQREEGSYTFVQVVCYHDDGALEKREELMRIVKSKDCKITYVDQLYGSF